MINEYQLRVLPQVAANVDQLRKYIAEEQGLALGALKDYEAQKAEGKNPVFKAETVGLKGKVDFWN